jgi:DNA-directed RNA polymerase specialized sigma24 family protein
MAAHAERLETEDTPPLSQSEFVSWLAEHKERVWERICSAPSVGAADEGLAKHFEELLSQLSKPTGIDFVRDNYSGQTSLEQWLALVVLRRHISAREEQRRPEDASGDLDLVRRVLQGDQESCSRFLTDARGWLEAHLLPKAGDSRRREIAHGVIDDLISDLFGKGLLERYRGTGSLRGWVCRAGLNRFRDAVQSGRFRYETEFPRTEKGDSTEDIIFEAAPVPSVEPVVLETLHQGLHLAFGSLSARELFLIRLVHLHGVERQVVANLLDVHPATVGREISQILDKVSRRLCRFLKNVDPDGDLDLSEYVSCADHFRSALHGTIGEDPLQSRPI